MVCPLYTVLHHCARVDCHLNILRFFCTTEKAVATFSENPLLSVLELARRISTRSASQRPSVLKGCRRPGSGPGLHSSFQISCESPTLELLAAERAGDSSLGDSSGLQEDRAPGGPEDSEACGPASHVLWLLCRSASPSRISHTRRF